MELLNEIVTHKSLGTGSIIGFDGQYVEIQFTDKISKFPFPAAFETFLTLGSSNKQEEILAELAKVKQAAEEDARKRLEESRKAAPAAAKPARGRTPKTIDEMFSDDYHAAHLARQPILTYQQVENQFGIKISGFGRGINPTATTVVLISSIGKSGDQTMTKGNLAIKNAARDGKELHLFVKLSPQEYLYQGVFSLKDFVY